MWENVGRMDRIASLGPLGGLLGLLLISAGPGAGAPVDYAKEIYPLLKEHCLACHSHGQVKGELRLDTVELMLKGGENGPALVRGDSEKSLIYRMVAGKEETVMPPRKNKVGAIPLSADQIKLLKRWIDEGAVGSPMPLVLNTDPVHWRPLPPGLNPIHSVAISPDGLFAACGRANQIFIYNVPANDPAAARLVDPGLQKELPAAPAAADHDLISSLAFSPDGMQLASGGYRSIRLWRRAIPKPALSLDTGLEGAPAAASPDGKWLAAAGPGSGIRVWEASSGRLVKELSGHSDRVRSLAFSPDGERLSSGSADHSVRVWTLSDGSSISVDAQAEVLAVAWASEGKRLAAGCADRLIRIFTVPAPGAGWEPAKELKGHTGPVTALSTVGPGKQILSGSEDGTLRLWDAETTKELRKMDHGAPVAAVAVQHDQKRWASAGGNTARLWKANGEALFTLKGDPGIQEALSRAERTSAYVKEQITYFKAFQQDHEKSLAVVVDNSKKAHEKLQSTDKDVTAKKAAAQKAAGQKAEADAAIRGPQGDLKARAAAKDAADAAALQASQAAKAASGPAAQAKAAAAKAGEQKAAAEKAVAALTPESPAEEAKAKKDKLAEASAQLSRAQETEKSAGQAAAQAEASAKTAEEAKAGAMKAHADLADRVKALDTQQKAAEKALGEATQALQQAEQARSAAEQNDERLVLVQKKGEALLAETKTALSGAEADLKAADAAVDTAKKAAADSEQPVAALAFSPDDRVLASSGRDQILHTWSTETGRAADQVRGLGGAPAALIYAPGGTLSVSVGSKIRIWTRLSAWTLERTLGTGGVDSPLMDRVLALAWSPDGKRLASGGGIPARAGELKIWNPADGTLVREIKDAHSDTVFGVAYSYDGKYLASGAADKFVKIFDPVEGKPRPDLRRPHPARAQRELEAPWPHPGQLRRRQGRQGLGPGHRGTAQIHRGVPEGGHRDRYLDPRMKSCWRRATASCAPRRRTGTRPADSRPARNISKRRPPPPTGN